MNNVHRTVAVDDQPRRDQRLSLFDLARATDPLGQVPRPVPEDGAVAARYGHNLKLAQQAAQLPAQLDLVRGPYDGPFRRRAFSTQVSRVRNDDPDVLLPVSESGRTDWRGLSNPRCLCAFEEFDRHRSK